MWPTGAIVNPQLTSARLQRFVDIVSHMTDDEKKDPLGAFPARSKERVARSVGCSQYEVEDCINSYVQMKDVATKVSELQAQGQPIPRSPADFEAMMGPGWRKSMEDRMQASRAKSATGIVVDSNTRGPGGQPCPFAGQNVNRNTVCPATKKKYKQCCGKQ